MPVMTINVRIKKKWPLRFYRKIAVGEIIYIYLPVESHLAAATYDY